VEDEPVDDRARVVAFALDHVPAAHRPLELRGAEEEGGMLPGIALLEFLVIAADHRDEARVDLPDADLELAVVFAFGDVDEVAGLALFQRLPGILEGLLLRAVAARGAGDDEPVASRGPVVGGSG